MTHKFPLWMIAALIVALVLTMGFTLFVWLLAHSMTGTSFLSPAEKVLQYAPPVVTVLLGLASWYNWQAGNQLAAKWLAIAPLPSLAAIFTVIAALRKASG